MLLCSKEGEKQKLSPKVDSLTSNHLNCSLVALGFDHTLSSFKIAFAWIPPPSVT
jgi:hypothetical protein